MKKYVSDILDYLKYQLEHDQCTMEQMQRIADFAKAELNAKGTIDDLAEFYGQSRNNVSNILSRRMIPKSKKPQRRVLYDFGWFRSVVPESWKKKKDSV